MLKFKQRANIQFCHKIGFSAAETLKYMQQVYGDDSMSKSVVYEWYKRFKEGRDSIGDYPKSGRPTTATGDSQVDAVRS